MLEKEKYKKFNVSDIQEDIQEKGVARFEKDEKYYSLFMVNAITFNLVEDSSSKMLKLKHFKSITDALNSL